METITSVFLVNFLNFYVHFIAQVISSKVQNSTNLENSCATQGQKLHSSGSLFLSLNNTSKQINTNISYTLWWYIDICIGSNYTHILKNKNKKEQVKGHNIQHQPINFFLNMFPTVIWIVEWEKFRLLIHQFETGRYKSAHRGIIETIFLKLVS